MPRSITPQTGGSPDPADVIGRDDTIVQLVTAALGGTNHLLNDPRRMGKTSLLIRLCNEPGENVMAVKVDLESASTVDEVVTRILRGVISHSGLAHRSKKIAARYLESVSAEVGPVKLSAVATAAGALQSLQSCLAAIEAKLKDDELLIIALDEVTIAAHTLAGRDVAQCDALLQTLRHLRGSEHRKVRWILSGSIGFHHVLRIANLTEGLINDVAVVELGPLAPEYASALTTALLTGIDQHQAAAEVVEHLVHRTNGIPFMLHNVVHRLDGSTAPITVAMAEAALTGYLTDKGQSSAWTHMVSRVRAYYDKDADLAEAILDRRAQDNTKVAFGDLLAEFSPAEPPVVRRVIEALVDDHYLDTSTFCWRYPLLREVWMIRRRLPENPT